MYLKIYPKWNRIPLQAEESASLVGILIWNIQVNCESGHGLTYTTT